MNSLDRYCVSHFQGHVYGIKSHTDRNSLPPSQGLSQDLETGCLKLAIVKFLGIHICRGYHNILRFQP